MRCAFEEVLGIGMGREGGKAGEGQERGMMNLFELSWIRE